MSKRDSEIRINRPALLLSGEMVSVGSVVQVSQLVVTGPFSGDFQIINNGRLIVGNDPDGGARGVMSPKHLKGYSAAGTNTFSLHFATEGDNTPGDLHLGNMAANFLLYDHSEGTLGLYTPAGAGILLDNDGSAQFGNAEGAHIKVAGGNLKISAGVTSEGEVIAAEITALGNASFAGIMTATGGRITGDMQVDAMLRAGDVDGPAVYVGKLVDEADGSAYAGYIAVTDTAGVPWFVVRTGDDGAGHLQIGRPGDYSNRLTLDVTPTGSTLVYDGAAYLSGGVVAGWVINAQQLVSPAGNVTLDVGQGVIFRSYDYGASTIADDGDVGLNNRMISYVNASGDVLHRIEAWSDTVSGNNRETLLVQAENLDGRAYLNLRSIGSGEAWSRLRAIGGWNLPGQQDAAVNVYAYRNGADFTSINLGANVTVLNQWTGAAAPNPGTGTIANGMLIYASGTWSPGAGEGLYFRVGGAWKPLALKAGSWDEVVYADSPFSAGDVEFLPVNAAGGNVVINLPLATTRPDNQIYIVKKTDASAYTVTIDAYSTANIDGALTRVLTAQWQYVWLRRQGADWRVIANG